MNITNPTHRAIWKLRAKKWSANAVAAKARKRIERGNAESTEPPQVTLRPMRRQGYAVVSIRVGAESLTFRVYRYDEKRLVCRGKVQAASSIGKRVALILENFL